MQQIQNQELISFLRTQTSLKDDEAFLAVDNPATQDCLGYVPVSSPDQIKQQIDKSHQAQKAWAKKTAKERGELMQAWYQLILENQDDLARIMTLEQGKPVKEAKGEVGYAASFVQWFAEEAKRTYGDTIPTPSQDRRIMTIKQPVGVACAITPWNFPIAMITRKAAPALAAGCSFIVKPAEATPISAFATVALAHQAGIPEDVLQIACNPDSKTVGEIFTSSPKIAKLSFTGSTQVGRLLMQACGEDIKKTSMELGGNAPFIVFDDADIDAAVEGAVASKFRNAGQVCVCSNRFYVHESIYDSFVDKFDQAVQKLKVGDGFEDGVDLGPLISTQAKTKVNQLLESAQKQGAKPTRAIENLQGQFVQPVVLRDVSHDMDIVKEEIFGPVAPIISFSSDEELIEKANDTIYGLAAYFYSQNIKRVWHVAEALEYGMVGINEGLISTEVAPFGGVKQSGVGREGAKEGIEEYLNIKYLCFGNL